MFKIGLVIGNGQSRKDYDLKQIPPQVLVYGCNALYRDFAPTVLFARDAPMVKEISEKYKGSVARQPKRKLIRQGKNSHYANPVIEFEDSAGKHHIEIPKSIIFTGSVATYCMASAHGELSAIYLLGFAANSNLYTGSENYGTGEAGDQREPTNKDFTEDLDRVLKAFPAVNFYSIGGPINGLSSPNLKSAAWGEMLQSAKTI